MSNECSEATIIPFPYHRVSGGRLTRLEREAALRWAGDAYAQSYAQVVFDDPAEARWSSDALPRDWEPDDAVPAFPVYAWVYYRGELWSVEPPARPGMRCALHRRLLGARIGDYGSLRAALEAIPLISEANPFQGALTASP